MAIGSSRRRRKTVLLGLLMLAFLVPIGVSVYLVKRGKWRTNVYETGVKQLAAGDRKAAEASFRDALAANPSDVGARMQLIGMLTEDRRFDEARVLALELTRQRDTAALGWKQLSEIAFSALDFAEAERLSRGVCDQEPSFPQRMRLQINDVLGSAENRSRALEAAINLVPLTATGPGKAALLLYGADTIFDLRQIQTSQTVQESMERAARDYLAEAAQVLQTSPEWQREPDASRSLLAQIEILSADPGARARSEARILADLDQGRNPTQLRAALAAAYTRQGRVAEAVAQIAAMKGPKTFFLWLRAVQRLVDAGMRAEAVTLLEQPPVPRNALLDLLRGRALIGGSAEMRKAGIALLVETAKSPTAKSEVALEAARVLNTAGAWEEAEGLLSDLSTGKGDARLQAEMARAMLRSNRDSARAMRVVNQLAGSVTDAREGGAVLGILESGGDRAAIRSYLDLLVQRFGATDSDLVLRRAVTYSAFAQQEKDAEQAASLRKQAGEDLRSVLAVASASKELLVKGWAVALGAREPELSGQFFARAVSMPGEPADLASLAIGLSAPLSDPSVRAAFVSGLRAGAPPDAKPFIDVLADAVSAPIVNTKMLLAGLQRVVEAPGTRSAVLLLMIRCSRELRDSRSTSESIDRLFREFPDLPIAREQRGQALLEAKDWPAVLQLHTGPTLSSREHAQRAQALVKLDRLQDALEEGRAYVRENPDDSAGFLSLAYLADKSSGKKAALGVLSAAPHATREIALQRAGLLAQLGELGTAEKLYVGLVAAGRGRDLAAWEGLAAVLSAAKRDKDLIRYTTDLLVRSRDSKEPNLTPLRSRIYTLRGMARESINSLEEALDDYQQAIALGTSDAATYNNAAWLLVRLKRQEVETAWGYAQRALELAPLGLNPEEPALQRRASLEHTAAMVLMAGSRHKEALAQIDQAIATHARIEGKGGADVKPDYLLDRAEILLALGMKEEAVKQLDEVLRAFAGTNAADRAAALRVRVQ